MHITKFALKNVLRAKGRSILIGIIVMIIAFAVCVALCIRQSATDSKQEALSEMNITAQISPDREAMMDEAMKNGDFDKSAFKDMKKDGLSLEELEKYSKADSVKSFYYIMSAYVNGSGDFEKYSASSDDDSDTSGSGMPDMSGAFGASGDFTITGYSSDESMTDFVDGTCKIEDGAVFAEGTSDNVCIISNELAEYNGLEVGDKIEVCSTDDDTDKVTLEITGIYSNSQASSQAMNMGGGSGGFGMTDPANNIYMSYDALSTIVSDSENIEGTTNGTYVLGTEKAYEKFKSEVDAIGLENGYTVSSTDLDSYERTSQPLENLAKFVGYFLIVVLVIGAAILVILNIFATRERKYEIGILTAIGLKKKKVARLFMTEILIITLAGVIVGGAAGSAVSVPLSNGLLSVVSQQNTDDQSGGGFGRDFGGAPPDSSSMPSSGDGSGFSGAIGNYVTDISASVDLSVLLQMLGVCLALALIAGMVSVIAIMRYEPLEILLISMRGLWRRSPLFFK